jgi:AcrR family transcriptional regulator
MPKTSILYEQAQQKRIISGAAKVFAEYGYDLTTMDQICQALNISKGGLYIYFKSKQDLFLSVLGTIYEGRYEMMSKAFAAEDPVPVKFEKLLAGLEKIVAPEDQTSMRLWVEAYLQSRRMPKLEEMKTKSYRQFEQLLQDLLVEGQQCGLVDENLDPANAAEMMMAVADGLMLHSLIVTWEVTPERVGKFLRDALTRSLVTTPND